MITFINVKNLKKYISWSIWGVYICFVIFILLYCIRVYNFSSDHDRPRLSRTTTSLTRDRQQTVLIKCCLFICQIFLYCLLMVIQQVYKSNRWRTRERITDANSSESLLEEMRDWYDDFIAISTYSFTVALDLSSFNI